MSAEKTRERGAGGGGAGGAGKRGGARRRSASRSASGRRARLVSGTSSTDSAARRELAPYSVACTYMLCAHVHMQNVNCYVVYSIRETFI